MYIGNKQAEALYLGNKQIPTAYLGTLGALLNQSIAPPTEFTSSFNVDSISAELAWVDNTGGIAQYEVYSVTNEAEPVLLATTDVGVTSYQDSTCKQNARVVYSIRAKKESVVSDLVAATEITTPLCWKTNQSVLTPVVINKLNIDVGKVVTINYSDGTYQEYSNDNINITKDFAAIGNYNIWLSGDTDSIKAYEHSSQLISFGDISNWVLPSNLTSFDIHFTQFTGDISNWVLPSNLTSFRIYITQISNSLPQIDVNSTKAMNYQAYNCYVSDSNVTVFRKAMTVFNIGSQNVVFPTANIDKLLKAIADWYQVNAPTANCTFTLSGANMGIPTGGASNVDLVRLVNYYTAAGRTATVLVRTS